MQHFFTQNQLIRYIYKETSTAETQEISQALEQDQDLFEKYQALMVAYQELPAVQFNPSDSAIENILGYSQQSAVETQL